MSTVLLNTEEIYKLLEDVKDPEIDTVSILDLGMVENVTVSGPDVSVKMLPTFLGCPALSIIQKNVETAIKQLSAVGNVSVEFLRSPSWTSDRITEKGKAGLKVFGISPPPRQMNKDGSWHIDCPYCESTYVTMENIFGPTACRSILYCKACKNPFEAMKPMIKTI
ncbi:1,2-phenylacetyl-CoA epoxidase subunit PaaD [Peribacillus butanolivorans]|uniref:Phenylacetate-CoA oxygenase subunit PaaJ n=1 Tax=Peribacillus butanolivorans TaxID=421767 RepID=A0AAX0RZC4_9BACI|nr:1,2-phenylacetyl-CoA epoxidase subunit PaaD [Peribacillus butanolivorans]AXN39964.1 phenylacetate-CoA oxygenase subunit PaaJ [Peribacillus butanolivorans]PEJ31606.1 phenylacetate-CoA oxygenase subunit PaaJ [Peribacillus butanolivorans]QNU06150.1 phenylacetate-CoA oxygenase subunit PaaJ [Peribacillus butanolivorans]